MSERNKKLIYPEVIDYFNVYNRADKLMGISGEINLAELSAITTEIKGAGILGSYNTAVIGMFNSMQQEIPFRMINTEFFDLMDTSQQAEIVLRSSVQNVNKSSGGALSTQGMRLVFRGRPTAFKPGKIQIGDMMNASVTLELTYYLIEMNGEKKMELDKLNEIYIVNGKDVLAEIRKQC